MPLTATETSIVCYLEAPVSLEALGMQRIASNGRDLCKLVGSLRVIIMGAH